MKFTSFFLVISICSSMAFAGNEFLNQAQGQSAPVANSGSIKEAAGSVGDFVGSIFDKIGSFFSMDKAANLAADAVEACKKNPKADFEVKDKDDSYKELKAEKTAISSAAKTCDTNADLAQKACLESLSPHIATAGTILGGLSSAVSMMSSAKDMCKESGNKLDMAKTALTLYNTACAGAKAVCDMMTCPRVATVVETQKASAKQKVAAADAAYKQCLAGNPEKPQICEGYKQDLILITAENTKLESLGESAKAYSTCMVGGCQKYGMQLAAAGAGIADMAMQSSAAKKCEKQLTAANDNKPLDCSKAENSNNATCICQKNPRQAGCPGITDAGGEPVNAVASVDNSTGGRLLNAPALTSGGVPSASPTGGADSGGSGNAGGVLGSTSSPSGGTSSTAKKGVDASKGTLDANIYSGEVSGGGGSGSSGGKGYGTDNKYSQYAPSKNQARQLAGGNTYEISGKSGKSNWDKVRERYADVRSKLINQ